MNSHRSAIRWMILLLSFTVGIAAFGQYPLIERIGPTDASYRQQQESIRQFYRADRTGEPLPPIRFYQYENRGDDSFIALAARFTLPYSTLASLNRIAYADVPDSFDRLIIPTAIGLFVPLEPDSELELLMHELRVEGGDRGRMLQISLDDRSVDFVFFAGADFNREERLAFFGRLFQSPIGNGRISSPFGWRSNPFTGEREFHAGIDFAVPIGTEVVAARSGVVTNVVRNDPIYGNYVLVTHTGKFRTLYGHLRTISVRPGQEMIRSRVLGTVGLSGRTTGSHLHFEIHQQGQARNPELFLPTLREIDP